MGHDFEQDLIAPGKSKLGVDESQTLDDKNGEIAVPGQPVSEGQLGFRKCPRRQTGELIRRVNRTNHWRHVVGGLLWRCSKLVERARDEIADLLPFLQYL